MEGEELREAGGKKRRWTAGPWRFERGQFNNDASEPNAIGSVMSCDEVNWFLATIENAPECEGNAHLIAAAPAMAEYIRKHAEAGDAEAVVLWRLANGNA